MRGGLLVLGILTFGVVSHAYSPAAGPVVEIILRGPDGELVRKQEVRLREEPDSVRPNRAPAPREHLVQTDKAGRVWLHLDDAVESLRIQVPGVGYGSTGQIPWTSTDTITISPPPLAPFARISGDIPPEFRGGDYQLQHFAARFANSESLPVKHLSFDYHGRFSAQVEAGWNSVYLFRGGKPVATGAVFVDAGEHVELPPLKPIAVPPGSKPNPRTSMVASDQKSKETTEKHGVWVTGVVRDQRGHPMPDVTVRAIANYSAGIRSAFQIVTAVTDKQGKYALRGELGVESFHACIVAQQSGKPIAVGCFRLPGRYEPALKEPLRRDLVINEQGGRLEVRVLRDNQPIVGALVKLTNEVTPVLPYFDIYRIAEGEESELEQAFNPESRTDEEGIARFEHLRPATYSVFAIVGTDEQLRGTFRADNFASAEQEVIWGQSTGVPVRQGENHHHEIAINQQARPVRFNVSGHDRQSVVERSLMFRYSPIGDTSVSSSPLSAGKNGEWKYLFPGDGLQSVEIGYREPSGDAKQRRSAYYAAKAVIAASPRLANAPPVKLTAELVRETYDIHVRVLDLAGKPIKAIVHIEDGRNNKIASGTIVDADAGVHFSGLTSTNYIVCASLPEIKPLRLQPNAKIWPKNQELLNSVAILPVRVSSASFSSREITLRQEPVGFIRGQVRFPADHRASDYDVELGNDAPSRGPNSIYSPQTGEFLAGPFAAGRVSVSLQDAHSWRGCTIKQVDVTAGTVNEIVVDVPDYFPFSGSEISLLPQVKLRNLIASTMSRGKVFLHDGQTPAHGAIVKVHLPEPFPDATTFLVGADGSIAPGDDGWNWNFAGGDINVGHPTIKAWLPGTTGPVVTKFDEQEWSDILRQFASGIGASSAPTGPRKEQSLQLRLPPSVLAKGMVTVGGKSLHGRPGSVRVVALPRDRAAPIGLLPVSTSAQADGSFELAGLTSGKYQVQAALDNIWLSASREIEVSDDGHVPSISLDIPEPGAPLVLRIAKKEGESRPCDRLTVQRPAGPLTDKLWPKVFPIDRQGNAYIPGLEVGEHTVIIGEHRTKVIVPPLSESLGKEENITIKLAD